MNQLKIFALFLCIQLAIFPQMGAQVAINTDDSDPDPSAMLDITSTDKGMLIPRLSTIQRTGITTPATGLLVYDMDTGSFWYREASGWKELRGNTLDEAYDQGGTGNGRIIDAVDGAVRIEGEDGLYVTGTQNTGSIVEITGSGTRMFFNPNKAAFRAGYANDDFWNHINIGKESASFGSHNIASGERSMSWGYYNEATGSTSTAWGFFSLAEGSYSTAWGEDAKATASYTTAWGFGTRASDRLATAWGDGSRASKELATSWGSFTTASGIYSSAWGRSSTASGTASTAWGSNINARSFVETALGQYEVTYTPVSQTVWDASDRLFVVANGLNSTTRSNALTILKNGNIGIGEANPTQLLHLKGTSGVDGIQYPDGTLQTTAFTSGTLNTLDAAYDQGGAGNGRIIEASNGAVRINGEDGFVVTGTFGVGDDVEVSGSGTRMFFNPKKAAFRAGYIAGTQWDPGNVGVYSSAWGSNTIASEGFSTAWGSSTKATGNNSTVWGESTEASGNTSTAWGFSSKASGIASTAWGSNPEASGNYSTAWGATTEALGNYSTAFGYLTKARSYVETTLGRYDEDYTPISQTSWNDADRLFVVANGTSNTNRSNALTILKNGNIGIGGATSPSDRFHVAGESTENAFRVQVGGVTKLRIYGGGGITLGYNLGSSPPYALQLINDTDISIGSARATSWVTYSDERIKSNIKDLDYGLSTILSLRPKSYLLHSSERNEEGLIRFKGDQTSQDIGFIAQEVYKIIPEVVYKPEIEEVDLWSMNYEKLTPILVKAIQELYEENQLLKEKNLQLEDQQLSMEERMQKIETALFGISEN